MPSGQGPQNITTQQAVLARNPEGFRRAPPFRFQHSPCQTTGEPRVASIASMPCQSPSTLIALIIPRDCEQEALIFCQFANPFHCAGGGVECMSVSKKIAQIPTLQTFLQLDSRDLDRSHFRHPQTKRICTVPHASVRVSLPPCCAANYPIRTCTGTFPRSSHSARAYRYRT
jgi:hypothetical protein